MSMTLSAAEAAEPLFEPLAGPLTVQYGPDEYTVVAENPPRFTWIAARPDHDRYVLQISASAGFDANDTLTYGPIGYNFFTPDRPLAPGRHYWRYALLLDGGDGGRRTVWSAVRSFAVAEGLPETPLPSREQRYAGLAAGHPRLGWTAAELESYRQRIAADPDGMGWSGFMAHSVEPWMERDLIAPYPNHQRTAPIWRKSYMACQEAMYAVRHLSIAGKVLRDESFTARAREWLLDLAAWETEGTTSRDYNDESAFRIAAALAWGYDWLYDSLSAEERALVKHALLRRTEQVALHVIDHSKIHHVPYDSHAVRALASVLVPCCLALLELPGEPGPAEPSLGEPRPGGKAAARERDGAESDGSPPAEPGAVWNPGAEQHGTGDGTAGAIGLDGGVGAARTGGRAPDSDCPDAERVREWLDYAVEYYGGLYSPWGGSDGGWAEGAHYWTTGMAYVIEALQMLKKYAKLDLFARPFFRHTGDFPLFVYPPVRQGRGCRSATIRCWAIRSRRRSDTISATSPG